MSNDNLNCEKLILTVNFACLYADDFSIDIELVDENRVLGLQQAWTKAIEHYSLNNKDQLLKQLKRKLGST